MEKGKIYKIDKWGPAWGPGLGTIHLLWFVWDRSDIEWGVVMVTQFKWGGEERIWLRSWKHPTPVRWRTQQTQQTAQTEQTEHRASVRCLGSIVSLSYRSNTPHTAQFEHSQPRGACLQLYFGLGQVNSSNIQTKRWKSWKKTDKLWLKLAKIEKAFWKMLICSKGQETPLMTVPAAISFYGAQKVNFWLNQSSGK